ncbi:PLASMODESMATA CALLOSE-BINDING PROTEIN 3-like isoform X1 [Oryza glaberrima]|uniref:X8 domain-containing protein n=1 Tax=Oryza glaberrima TaxID=4538 RepID=I1NPX6_ORYGL|nr:PLASMODESMATA CALLOSE-BINDING PROTEIN 3-like isoform X1 [Oryza glaberrima]
MAYLGLLVLLLAFCGGAEHHGAEAAGDASARGASARRGLATVSVAKPSYPTVTTPMSASTSPSTMPMSSSPSAFPSLATAGGGGGGGGGGSWCVASQSASPTALQVALDYACGYGADCSAIQPGGSCFNPDTVHDHASYAFNSYYQKNPVATSCDFGGTATITNTDPSSGSCQYSASSGGGQNMLPPPSPTTLPPSTPMTPTPTTPMTPTPTTPDTGTPIYGGSTTPPDYGSMSPPGGFGSNSPPDYGDVGAAPATMASGRAAVALAGVLIATVSLMSMST